MRKTSLFLLVLISLIYSTQWQVPEQISYTGDTPNFTYDNQKMYVTIQDGSPTSENIGYNTWNGNSWIWVGDVTGDIRTATYNEEEPFITYDNQVMYFVRAGISGNFSAIYKATRVGSSEVFNGSVALGPQINNINGQPYAKYPSLTQDQQKLYFTAIQDGRYQIFEATWNGSDWDNVTVLPQEVNGSDTSSIMDVCISPDDSEIYFRIDPSGPIFGKLAFSKKIAGAWQQRQYCDNNINGTDSSDWVTEVGITNGVFSTQELFFTRVHLGSGTKYHALRSPITVQPTSLGSIKAIYGNK